MSKLLNKPTPTVQDLAKKYNVSMVEVKKQLLKGIKVEKEHTNNSKIAREIALDHLGEKLDYYKLLSKIDEETGIGGVRGLGYFSGDPGVNYVQQYIDTNSMSYNDENGNKLEWIKKQHTDLHNKGLGFEFFDPTDQNERIKKALKEGISAGPARDITDVTMGDYGGARIPPRALEVKEGAKLDKAKRAVMAGVTAANIYTAGDVMSKAAEGRGSAKGDVVRMASTLPGAAGWAATGVHYAKKAYDKVKQMKEEKDPCWKGYEMIGMKKKGARKVPNCVPMKEHGGAAIVPDRYTERPTYENKSMGETLPKVGGVERGIYQEGYASIGHAYDWAGDVNTRAKFYGKKPKATTTKNDEKDDTYKDSNKGKKVKFAKTVKEEQIDEISAELVGKVSNARFWQGKAPSKTLSRAITKKFIESGKKKEEEPPFEGSHKRSHEKSSTHVRRLALKAMQTQKEKLKEATYQGKEVPLNKPMKGDVKKSKVYVDPDGDGKAQKVNFGDKKLSIKKDQPARKKSYCARSSGQGNLKDKTSANYWSRRAWDCEESVVEAALDVAATPTASPAGLRASTKLGRNAPTEISTRGSSQGLNRTGNTFRTTSQATPQGLRSMRSSTATPTSRLAPSSGPTMKPTSVSGPQVATPKTTTPTVKGSFGSGGGSMKPSSIGGKTSFSQGGSNIGAKMAASKQTSPVVKGMTSAGRAAVAGAEKAATSAVARAAGAMSGPVGAAVGAAAPALGAAMKQSHETGHKSFTQHADSGEKASTVFDRMRGGSQGRSVGQYEKDVLTPKASEAPKTPENPKVDAPTPPSRPDYFSRGQAFGAARKEAGGGEGKFSYDSKSYQTNVSGEPYKPSSQLKQTSVKEETTMDTKDLINEAIGNIMEDNLVEMKDNLMAALQEKAVEKLEERKKEIASNYFAQD